MADQGSQMGNRTFQPDCDVHVTLEDQEKINQFAKCNAKNDDIKIELIAKQNHLQNLEDAAEELILLDEDSLIPFQYGEIFVYLNINEANKAIETSKNKIVEEVKTLKETGSEMKAKMNELKAHLYSKFGTRINLEEEE